jgi:hypothetical protein
MIGFRRVVTGLWFVLCMGLAACGGGGSGGGSSGSTNTSASSDSAFSVTADKSAISLAYDEGSIYGASATVTVTTHGTYSGTLYVGAIVNGSGISSSIPLTYISDTQGMFTISALTGLSAGSYSGTVLLYACSDAYCNNVIGGTPLTVAYTLVVSAPFTVSPAPLSLSATSGKAASSTLTVTPPAGASGFTASVVSGSSWLTLGTLSATQLPVTALPWRSGTYSGSIAIVSGGKTRTIPVSYTVTASTGEHDLQVLPGSLTFASTEGSDAATQALSIALPTWMSSGDVTTSINYGVGSAWLSVTRTASGANVVASAAGLAQGNYTATITFTPPAPGVAVSVPVAFTVGAGLVQPAASVVKIDATTSSTSLSSSVTVSANGSKSLGWTASAADAWLKLASSSGATGTGASTLQYSVDASTVLGWTNFATYSTVVTITPTQAGLSPVKFTVSFNKALPEVYFLGPYTIVSGKESTVHVRGAGFDSVADLAAGLQTSGLSIGSVTRVNDTQLLLKVTPTEAGSYALSFGNALGATNSATLNVVAPQTYATAVVSVPGQAHSIEYDAVRQSVYAVNTVTEAIDRIHFDGAGWTLSAVSFPSVQAGTMGPDGSSFLAYSSNYQVRLISPDTLSTSFSLTYSYLLPDGFASAATTNDGRTWLSSGDLVYFDHRSRTIKARAAQSGLSTAFQGPWMNASRNGERMLVTQAPINYGPPLLYMDATDNLLHANPAGLSYVMNLNQSDDGSRAMFEHSSVRDASFGLIGNLSLPSSNYTGMAAVLAPDGKRAYVLAYDDRTLYASTTAVPRVYVFDTSPAAGLYTSLPVLGYIDMPVFPGCHNINDYNCHFTVAAAISPDGNALFFQGDQYLVVLPTGTLSASSAALSTLSVKSATSSAKVPVQIWNKGMAAGAQH